MVRIFNLVEMQTQVIGKYLISNEKNISMEFLILRNICAHKLDAHI